MIIWFPAIRAGSGSDIYVERLVDGLRERGVDARLQWFEHACEFLPQMLCKITAPSGTGLIHANSWNGFAFARPSIPLVVTAFHCVCRNGYPQWKTRAQSLYHDYWIGRYERLSFARADAVVAMTPSAAADFEHRFAMPPLTLIHGWVDTEVFKPAEPRSRHAGRTRILIVGNASKRKGMDLLPQLAARLGDRFAITVVGGLRAAGDVDCAGVTFKRGLSLHDLVREYQETDIVVSLSRYEGFGYTALEATACGKPVVAFAAVGIRDVVAEGASGLLGDIGDVSCLSALCERLARDPDEAAAMGCRGRVLAVERFGKSAAVDDYLKLYHGLLR